VSIGASTLDTVNGTEATLLQEADVALYHSKANGRNSVHHAGELQLAGESA
jgi:GGDEF domain-containing protein